MQKLMIYVCGHDELLDLAPDRPYLTKVNLNTLPVGEFQNNAFSESRIFFAELEPSEYVGFVTANWKYKWPLNPSLQQLNKLDYQPNIVWCGSLERLEGTKGWFDVCDTMFPQLIPFIVEMSEFSGLSYKKRQAPVSQNFICHWNVYQRFLKQWRTIFDCLYSKYSIEDINKNLEFMPNSDPNRLYGYLCERITMLVFSNMEDIELREVTQAEKHSLKLPRRLFTS